MLKVSVVGGSGYAGGELIRLLLGHPAVALHQVTSERQAGRYVYSVHPNLRRALTLRFSPMKDLEPCDVLFLALPHGRAAAGWGRFSGLGGHIIDLSADFRLRDPAAYPRWYGYEHPHPDLLRRFVYGLPELHREELKGARLVSGTGCLATTAILGLAPLFRHGLVERRVILEVKVGSSAAGSEPNLSTHHPERDGVMRSFSPTGHRHTAEIEQELTFRGERPEVYMSATAVEAVRGALVTAHCFLRDPAVAARDLWRAYREDYESEPCIRLVMDRAGVYRYPEPKLLSGTNLCDVGFEREEGTARVVVMAALDNLVKGAAGNALQAMNIMLGVDERAGLESWGLHPA